MLDIASAKVNEMKTKNLTGVALDWAVCKANGEYQFPAAEYIKVWMDSRRYSHDWAIGGPIIEREKCIATIERLNSGDFRAQMPYDSTEDRPGRYFYGRTPLTAAMRCFVASKLGDDVNIPDELYFQ
tara:strand:+ start:350 stop:730 length:381 start_codon:yes stop_codon:yes gene_type:complete